MTAATVPVSIHSTSSDPHVWLDDPFALPLVITPSRDRSVENLRTFLDSHRKEVQTWIIRHGAILFRGFDVTKPEHFETIARGVDNDLKNEYLGTSPRNALTPYVFSASELPPYYPIPQHCEMSFLPNAPSRVFFSCLIEPKSFGGETPLVDFRRVAQDLSPELRERFAEKGVTVIRNYTGPGDSGKFDLWQLKRWDEMFLTTDKAQVEQKCRQLDIQCEWLPGNKLRLTNTRPAFQKHPVTGELVWFNHSQVFHLSAAAAELRRVGHRTGQVRSRLLSVFASATVYFKSRMLASNEHSMHCTFGDGTEISNKDMDQVRDAIWKNMKIFRWQLGDVVAIDNFSVSHGRMPYSGPRLVVVAWS
ncbi:MAG: TauD/TfdA family dioxygenase [Myxococcales bacterium]|nr:TauD/TfdA family dioxygenase [Myxococcales bacterium]